MKNLTTKIFITTVILAILAISLTACTQPEIKPIIKEEGVNTLTFASEIEYTKFLEENTGRNGGFYGGGVMAEPMILQRNEMIAMADTALIKADFSETNNQVRNVDEGDILKTDGEYIYTVSDKTLFIVKAGEDAEVISKIEFEDYPTGLFIENDKLAVFGRVSDLSKVADAGIRVRSGMTFIELYDISNKEKPSKEKEFQFEGDYFNSRLYEGNIYLMTSLYPEVRPIPLTPIIIEDDIVTNTNIKDIRYFDIEYQNPSFVGIHSINIENNEKIESKQIMVEGSSNMYMSEENIYITYLEYMNEWELQRAITQEILDPKMPEHYKNLIQKIESVDSAVLSKQEKQNKISDLYNEYLSGLPRDQRDLIEDQTEIIVKEKLEKIKYFEHTIINRIEVNKGDLDVKANGKVPGHIVNQFSMDEYEDVFRIATTTNQRWSRFDNERTESLNNIYTLDEDLKILDDLEGLAQGERIFSTRFMGDKLYMVTFRQVDPFFVIDLSNPNKIEELGELKIPGFSRYLHPYDENTIIGIGRDATETGRQLGLKISLFDVKDVKNPKEIAKYVSNDRYSRSTAEFEHKAFLFSKDKELLVIPVLNNDWQEKDESYNGAFVFKITKDDINLRGLIDHEKYAQNQWQPAVERSLYIDNNLYTKSKGAIRINALDDLKSVKDVILEFSKNLPIKVY